MRWHRLLGLAVPLLLVGACTGACLHRPAALRALEDSTSTTSVPAVVQSPRELPAPSSDVGGAEDPFLPLGPGVEHLGDVWGTGRHPPFDEGGVSRAYRDRARIGLYRLHVQPNHFGLHDPDAADACQMETKGITLDRFDADPWVPAPHRCHEFSDAKKLRGGLEEGRVVLLSLTEDHYRAAGTADPLRAHLCDRYAENWYAYARGVAEMVRREWEREVRDGRIWFECHNEPNNTGKHWEGNVRGPVDTGRLDDGLWADRVVEATVACLRGIRDAWKGDGFMPRVVVGSVVQQPGELEHMVEDYLLELGHERKKGDVPPFAAFGVHYPGDHGQLGRLFGWLEEAGLTDVEILNTEMSLRSWDPDCSTPGDCPLDMDSLAASLDYAHKLMENARFGVRGIYLYELFSFEGENGPGRDDEFSFVLTEKSKGRYCYSNRVTERRAFSVLELVADGILGGELYEVEQENGLLALANESRGEEGTRTRLLVLNRTEKDQPLGVALSPCGPLHARLFDGAPGLERWDPGASFPREIPPRALALFEWNGDRTCATPTKR